MQHFLCPQCGAAVTSQSLGAVMVVCPACRSTLMRDAETARQVGRLSAVVDDGSPVRLGTRGALAGHSFQVVGRLRMQYEEGGWNEWYVLFDAGGAGWLSDASGQYALTRQGDIVSPLPLPGFGELRIGAQLKFGGVLYTVADIRRSRCVGGEGELPVHPGDGWDTRAADLRGGRHFATLDYSDGAPVAYVGQSGDRLKLDEQTLRTREDIVASIGRVRGQIQALDCPNCGASVTIVAAMATQVICGGCGSLLDCSAGQAEVIEAHRRTARFKTTLPLGSTGQLAGNTLTVIGVMRCEVQGELEEPAWTEYLLLEPLKGYQWLVESEAGWQLVRVCDEWPVFETPDAGACRFQGAAWSQKYRYTARVAEVYGAFNWRVLQGDQTEVTEFAHGTQMLAREQSESEITWSLAMRVSAATVHQAFGVPRAAAHAPRRPASSGMDDEEEESLGPVGLFASLVLLGLSDEITVSALLAGLMLVWIPPLLLGMRDTLMGEG